MLDSSFVRDLIKGKIAELIFQQMFIEAGECTVIPLGYENTLPELAQFSHLIKYKKVLTNIRTLPDFIIMNRDRSQAYFVEVKYRSKLHAEDLIKHASITTDVWDPKLLFVATLEGFFLSPCSYIIKNQGSIEPLNNSWIHYDLQKKYLGVLKMFLGEKEKTY